MSRERNVVYITQQVEFAASHRLFRPDWSPEKNFEIFGKCSNEAGHGHDYRLEAVFKGEVDKGTGMAVHFDILKRVLKKEVHEPLDYHNLNVDVALMEGLITSSENLIVQLWDRIAQAIQKEDFSLYRLSLFSSVSHRVDFFGPEGEGNHHV